MKKSKKILIVLVILILIIITGVSIYLLIEDRKNYSNQIMELEGELANITSKLDEYEQNNSINNTESDKDNSVTNGISSINPSDYILDLYNEKYKDSRFIIPKVNINSTYANKINARMTELKDDAEKFIQDLKNNGAINGESYTQIDYKYYVNNEIMSIIVMKSNSLDNDSYEIFNINLKNGNQITNEEILSNSNVSESNFQEEIYNYITNNKTDWYSKVDEIFYASKEDCSIEKCSLTYLDNGIIAAAINVSGTDVGGQQMLNIETGEVIEEYSINYNRW